MVSPGIYSKLGVVFYIILQGDSLFLILEFIGALNAIYPAVGVATEPLNGGMRKNVNEFKGRCTDNDQFVI